jgi:Mg-chelatase subunit ChlD
VQSSTSTRDAAALGGPERFALLAEAVAGRTLAVVSTDAERAYTDGEAIHLPASAEPWELVCAVIVQSALLRAGSFEPGVLMTLAGRRAVRLRYLTLEAARAASVLVTLFPRWVSARITDLYSGDVPADPRESLRWAQQPRRRVPEAPTWLGTVKPIVLLRANPVPGIAPTDADLQSPTMAMDVPELDDEEESERSRILELFSAPISNPLANALQKLLGMGRTPGQAGSGGAELPVGGRSFGPVSANARVVPNPLFAPPPPPKIPFGARYPEWNHRSRSYLLDWCAVAEFDPAPQDAAEPLNLSDGQLRRQLARLGLRERRHRRQEVGDEIDIDALIQVQVDLAAQRPSDPRVHEARLKTAHDLGVLVLLDATGSTGESWEGRSVFEEQRLVAARLTAAFTDLGDRVAAFGFYSRGREAVRYLRIKDFDDRFDLAAQRRVASLEPSGFTRLGAAIRHGTHILTERSGTTQRLLVLVGDGLPYEDGYEHRYAQADSARALAEAVAAGVGCVAIGVRTTTDAEILEHVWGDVPHVRIEAADDLAGHVGELFGTALRMAAGSRRIVSPAP